MNSLDEAAGGGLSGTVDWQGSEGTPNLFPLNDPTQWHEFWINVFAPGGTPGSHLAVVYADGGTPPSVFDVSAGNGEDFAGITYIAMGLGATPQIGAVDIDFFSWAPGILEPVTIGPGLRCDFTGDELCGVDDINMLMNEAETGGTSTDLNGDGVVNDMDRDEWLALAGPKMDLPGHSWWVTRT